MLFLYHFDGSTGTPWFVSESLLFAPLCVFQILSTLLDFPLCEWRVSFATVYWVVKQRYCFLSPLPPLKATKTEKGGGLHILPQFSKISVPLFSDIEKNNCFTIIYARSDLYNSRSKHLQNPFKVNLNDVSKRRPFCFV